jgi:hypothetical protein
MEILLKTQKGMPQIYIADAINGNEEDESPIQTRTNL